MHIELTRKQALIYAYGSGFTFFFAIAFILRFGTLAHGIFLDTESQMSIQPMQAILNNQAYVYGERPLLLYIILIPYWLSAGVLGLNGTIFFIHTLFLLLSLFLIYFITLKITCNYDYSLFAVAIFAVMPTAVLTQAYSNYIGDFFVPVLALSAIYLFIIGFFDKKYLNWRYIILSFIVIIFAYNLWNGGIYALIIFIIAILAYGLSIRIGTCKTVLLMLILAPILFICYLHLSKSINGFNLGPDLSNVNAKTIAEVPTLNIMTLFTQQNMIYGFYIYSNYKPPLDYIFFTILFSIGSLLYFLPIILLLFKNNNHWFTAIFAIFIFSVPFAVLNARYESLVIMPLAILAGTGAKYILNCRYKIYIYFMLLAIMFGFVIIEVLPFISYY